MFGYNSFSVEFLTGTPMLVTLATIVLLALSVWLYFRTNPPTSLPIRVLLGTIRAIAVLVLVAALFEPVISYTRQFERKSRVALLLDRSLSMEREENGLTRRARLDSLLSTPAFEQLSRQVDVSTYYFADILSSDPEQLSRDRTALGESVQELDRRLLAEPADHWLMFSDGNSNAGRRPAEAVTGLRSPILAVNLAANTGDFDVSISEVDVNPVLFVGQPAEVKVRLAWDRAGGQTIEVQLTEEGRTLTSTRLQVSEEGGFGDVTLQYAPTEPGQKLLTIRIPVLQSESIADNNSRTVAVKVLKSRVSVLLVADRPDYEAGFLRRFLEQSDRFDVTLLASGSKSGNLRGAFPSRQAELNRFDLVILYDPDPQRLESRKDVLASYLSDRGGGVWILMGEQFAAAGPQPWLNELLPFWQATRTPVRFLDVQGVPEESSLFHPSVRLADDRAGIREVWSELPPFKVLVPCPEVSPRGVVLAYAGVAGQFGARLPVLGYRRVGPGKVIASAALPYWPWKFAALGYGGDAALYGRFLDGTTTWLTVQEDFDPVRISPEKEVFSRGEPVRFEGLAFDQGYRPIPNVTGLVQLVSEVTGDTLEADLILRDEGRYQAEFDQPSPGVYRYTGSFEKDGSLLKRREGRIQIETFSLEEFDQRGDPGTLMALARGTGGRYATFNQFETALESVTTDRVTETTGGEIILWGKLWLLLLFVGLLALEWFLRKAFHLI
ncbi:MAG: hypothetical protein KKA42_16610 [candidate division Zixibacteria bacterium]|nr:hypothetical protein [candidate division Zixibacteria bacterium]